MYGYIYRITDLTNGKCYIGQRKWDKPGIDLNYWGSGIIISNIVRKRKEEDRMDTLLREKLMDCATLEELNYFETYFIEHLNTLSPNGYNLNTGGDQKIASEETKAKISAAKKGKHHTEEAKQKMRGRTAWNKGLPKELNPRTGSHHSEEWNLHIKESNKKRYESEEIKLKISEKVTKYFISEEELYDLYIVQGLSVIKIAELYRCTPQAISYKLKKYKISKK